MEAISTSVHLIFAILLGVALSCQAHSHPKVEIKRADDDGVHADITTKDGQINLQFKPADGIFSRNFRINGHEGDPQEWIDFEKELMVAENGAVAHIENDEVKSLLDPHNEIYINQHDLSNGVVRGLDTNIYAKSHSLNDYVDLNLKTTVDPTLRRTRGPTIMSVKPEVHIVVDMAFYKQFNGNDATIKSYLSMFFHGVNNRFATLANPKISFIITSLTVLKEPKDQPFIEIARIAQYNNKEVDMDVVLPEFAKWTFDMKLSKTADLVALISAEDFMDKDDDGNYQKGIAGIAYLGGACRSTNAEKVNGQIVRVNKYIGTSVSSDQGVIWSGVFTLAHELAHNLKAKHDENSSAPKLPAACQWDRGYLMSYVGYGTPNKFKFSPCSSNMMLEYMTTVEAQCLREETYSEVEWNVNSQPGQTRDMHAQCKQIGPKIAGSQIPPQAVWKGDFSAKDRCLMLSCTVDLAGYMPLNVPFKGVIPLDETPCNAQGTNVCRNGSCVPK